MREVPKVPESTFSYDFEVDGLLLSNITVKSGFALDDPEDPRYKVAETHRGRFGELIHRATKVIAMRNSVEAEDHVDAIISIAKAAEVFLLEYGVSRGQYSAQRKAYTQLREYVVTSGVPSIKGTDTSFGIACIGCLLDKKNDPG
jgi:proteasome activator subunit 4